MPRSRIRQRCKQRGDSHRVHRVRGAASVSAVCGDFRVNLRFCANLGHRLRWKVFCDASSAEAGPIDLTSKSFLCIGVARGEAKGPRPKFLAHLVILCSERWCPKQDTVTRSQSQFIPPKFCAGYATVSPRALYVANRYFCAFASTSRGSASEISRLRKNLLLVPGICFCTYYLHCCFFVERSTWTVAGFEITMTQGRTEGQMAPGTRNRPRISMLEPRVFREQMCCNKESTCDISRTFRPLRRCVPLAPLGTLLR